MAVVRKTSPGRTWSAFLGPRHDGTKDPEQRTRSTTSRTSIVRSRYRYRLHHQNAAPYELDEHLVDQAKNQIVSDATPVRSARQQSMIHITSHYLRMLFRILSMFVMILLVGCGTTRERLATDQLLLSDAVDRSIAHIDFSPLAGETVFLDSQYVRSVKSAAFVNADYIISSLRQQMLLSGCLLQDSRDEADIIVEARVGTLGHDAHDVNYGLPANNAIQTAAEIVSNAPPIPSMPDVSLIKKSEESAAAKIAVFAFRRESKTPVWQSGLSVARSTAKNKWLFGAGPFQSGEIYKGTHFAGEKLRRRPFQRRTAQDDAYSPELEAEQAFRSPSVFDEQISKKLFSETTSVEYLAESSSKEPAGYSKGDAKEIDGAAESTGVSTAGHQESARPAKK